MSLLRRSRLCLQLTTGPEHASPALTSSSQLWASAVQAFYAEYASYMRRESTVLRMTTAATGAMERCLMERRPAEALEVYETLCRCGLVGLTATSSASRTRGSAHHNTNNHKWTKSGDSSHSSSGCSVGGSGAPTAPPFSALDVLAQRALDAVPHRRCQHTILSLIMAAEGDAQSDMEYAHGGTSAKNDPIASTDVQLSATRAGPSHRPGSPSHQLSVLPAAAALSAAERARIRVHQHLHTLHATGQLTQPLGKEYCLVEMQELCTGVAASQLAREVEVDPLRTLSACVLTHPFAYATPSAQWAQRELLWESDMRSRAHVWRSNSLAPSSASSSLTADARRSANAVAAATLQLTPADAARLSRIDDVVRPYRSLCGSALEFVSTFLPNWDALLVRRVAETLVLPAEAHLIFPAEYESSRAATRRRGSFAGLTTTNTTDRGGRYRDCLKDPHCAASTAWTDGVSHPLFPCGDLSHASSSPFPSSLSTSVSASPLKRVEAIVRRRRHHDVVVPDTNYVLHRFHQLCQLARHREVVITHAVFLELVAAAACTAHPLRFHARRILRSIMHVTTTTTSSCSGSGNLHEQHHSNIGVVTVAARLAAAHDIAAGREGGSLAGVGERRGVCAAMVQRAPAAAAAASRKATTPRGGFTLLGLQDELALLDCCPERFFLQADIDADSTLHGVAGHVSTSPYRSSSSSSSVSVVLVAKQLERLIAAHDRGADVTALGAAVDHRGSSDSGAAHRSPASSASCLSAPPLDVDGLVRHILEGQAPSPTTRREEPLFKTRSRGHWARLPIVVATTKDDTRAAAFQVGLSMYPPAGVAP